MRPSDLPDFDNPPLNEVVIGVQFATTVPYPSIRTYEIWSLFKDRFPDVQEAPALPPTFETFGLHPSNAATFQFRLSPEAPRPRYWFLAEGGAELVQFQADRLLHNWRKLGTDVSEYPRFEKMIASFSEELEKLSAHFETEKVGMKLNQCEVSYVNHIVMNEKVGTKPGDWLNYINLGDAAESFQAGFSEVIFSTDQKPIGRLYCESQSAFDLSGRPIVILQLSAKGAPTNDTISDALDFINRGRVMIGKRFLEITSTAAHAFWGRKS